MVTSLVVWNWVRWQKSWSGSHAGYAVHFAARPQFYDWVQYGVRSQPTGSSLESGSKAPLSKRPQHCHLSHYVCVVLTEGNPDSTTAGLPYTFHATGRPLRGHEGLEVRKRLEEREKDRDSLPMQSSPSAGSVTRFKIRMEEYLIEKPLSLRLSLWWQR